jgi:superfamily II DNA or RNA helicase
MFLENYAFKYPWRRYQAKVLAELEAHMHDDKLNVVAAPGSGKTILGLEIVRRLNKNVLILSPTLTIKNQWVDRFLTLFVQDDPVPEFISTDIYSLNRFNVATYQGLHFAYRRKKIEEQFEIEEEEGAKKSIRGTDIAYDLVSELKAKNIEVIVLDEAHHLRSAWWKSLTSVLKSLEGVKTIALTATPPYDVDKSEWDKYVEICGPIDSEISVPELVATKDLCHHQDFVIFNMLTPSEEVAALNIRSKFLDFAERLKQNQGLIRAIAAMPELTHSTAHEIKILENPKYYSSLLVFLKAVGERIDKKIIRILSGGASTSIPVFSMEWLEIMLQGVLLDDQEMIAGHSSLVEAIRDELNKIGGIEKRKVMLKGNDELSKLLAGSAGKMESIVEIARREYDCLQDDLSMVVLADYIRIEALEQDAYNKIGVVPIFKRLLQAEICPNVAILTGRLKVIPISLIPFVKESLPECEFEEIAISGYVSIKIRDRYKNQLVSTITDAVIQKKLNIVVGTVALLGEGWDCQAVNSLVLASFVGSFMLSNQMRGRAIRRSKTDPGKVANIWHLASITRSTYDDPSMKMLASMMLNLFYPWDLSDYHALKRRFQGFVGIAYTENLIQNGLERLDIVDEDKLPKEHKKINRRMYELAKNRSETRRRWDEILALFGDEDINIVNTFQGQEREERFKVFAMADLQKIAWALLLQIAVFLWLSIAAPDVAYSIFMIMALVLWQLYFVGRLIGHYNPVKNMRDVGRATFAALHELGAVKTSPALASSRTEKINRDFMRDVDVYITKLRGATVYENNLYIKCVQEIYRRVDNPRYVIKVKNLFKTSYFNVPAMFANNKANAEILHRHWKKYVGKGKLIYTRSVEGRSALFAARKGSFDYNEKFFERKRALKKDDWK